MCSAQLRVCPVYGCTSIPLKHLEKHLLSVHTDLTTAQTAQLLRTAAVFRVPAGKTRRDVVVRKGGKGTRLQLAKKSTGGFPATRDAAAESKEGEGLPRLRERPRPRRTTADKAIQCNLLPLLQPFHKAASNAHQHSLPVTCTPRPQYAKKSTCNTRAGSEAAGSVEQGATGDGLSPKRTKDDCPVVDSSRRTQSPPVGKPCEIMAKWGSWDVIFYETPPSLLTIPHVYT